MAIKNTSVVYDVNVANNRKAIGHRATWMGLTYQEGVKAGVDAEGIARKAISQTGCLDGEDIKKACTDATDCRQFKEAFLSDLAKTTFQIQEPEQVEGNFAVSAPDSIRVRRADIPAGDTFSLHEKA